MNGTTLLMYKGAVDINETSLDNNRIELRCGGYMKVQESYMEGLKILPSGNIQISEQTFHFSG